MNQWTCLGFVVNSCAYLMGATVLPNFGPRIGYTQKHIQQQMGMFTFQHPKYPKFGLPPHCFAGLRGLKKWEVTLRMGFPVEFQPKTWWIRCRIRPIEEPTRTPPRCRVADSRGLSVWIKGQRGIINSSTRTWPNRVNPYPTSASLFFFPATRPGKNWPPQSALEDSMMSVQLHGYFP